MKGLLLGETENEAGGRREEGKRASKDVIQDTQLGLNQRQPWSINFIMEWSLP